MSCSIKRLFATALLLSTAWATVVSGAGGSTTDYAWLLFLKVNEPPVVDAGMDQTIDWAADSASLDATVSGDPRDTLIYDWSKLSGPGDVSFSPPDTEDTTAIFTDPRAYGSYVLQLTVTDDGGLSAASTVTITLNNSAPSVDIGSNKSLNYPSLSTFIDATASDHPNDLLSYSWIKTAGPGNVTFSPSNAEDTQATFSASGVYTLRLSVDDGLEETPDWVNVTIVNNPPVVDISRDSIETTSNSVDLAPEVTDPTSGVLSYQWRKDSGPGTVSFSNSNAVNTTATLGQVGTYVLRLTASDGEKSGFDTVQVIYQQANNPPVVNIIRDSIETTSNSVPLAPEVTDPDGDALSYQWRKDSGPGTVSFSNPNAVNTTATLGQVGTYVLRLTASDGDLSGFDTVEVIYLQAPVNGDIDVVVAVGDSITVGFGDSNCIEGNAKACSGYTARLKGMLAGQKNYANSVTIWEEGKGGETALGGLSRINGIISAHPAAEQYLFQYGTNDADSDPPPSKALFKSRMGTLAQRVYDSAGHPQPAIAKAPKAKNTQSYRNSWILLYNAAVVELYNERSYIKVSPPDFYTHFANNPGQIWSYFMFDVLAGLPIVEPCLPPEAGVTCRRADDLHPRDTGYDAMANIWRFKLTQ